MRVALVAETFLPAVNGVVNSVVRVAEHLVAHGHEPVVIAPTNVRRFSTASGRTVPVISCRPMRVPGYPGLVIARPGLDLRPVLREVRPDVIHLASPLVLGWAASIAAADLGVPVVSVFQTDLTGFLSRYGLGVAGGPTWGLLRRLHNRTALTLAPSSSSAAELRAHGITPVAIWGRGVDAQRFNPRHRDDALNRELGGGRPVVGFVGRLAPEKRVELLSMIDRLPGVRLVVVGDGPRRRRLERQLPNAAFLGLLSGADLSRTMASLDLLVNPGANETFCQVVQEALASGVPVLTAAAGGPLDLVRHRDNGWLWSGDDPAVLAAQVESIFDDRAALASTTRRARPSVVRHSWSRLGDELLGHYSRVLGDHQRPPVAPETRRAWVAAYSDRSAARAS